MSEADEPWWVRHGLRLLAGGLVALGVLVVLLSRKPRLPAILGISAERLEPVGHITAAALLALVVTVLAARQQRSAEAARRPALVGFAVAAVLTTLIEAAQFPHPTRSASLDDAVANLVGAALGAGAAVLLGRLAANARLGATLVALATAISGSLWVVVVDVPLGRACPTEIVADPAPQPVPTIPAERVLVSYDLADAELVDDGTVVAPERNGGPELFGTDLGGIDTGPDGVVFDAGHTDYLFSQDAGDLVSSTIRGNRTVAVETTFTPSAMVGGPARIVSLSFSHSTAAFNFHIGQDDDDLSVRLRLGCGHFNWTRIAGIFEVGETRNIVVTFSEQRQRIWVDGELIDERLFGGDFVDTRSWDPTAPLVVANEPTGVRPFYGTVESLTIGVVEHLDDAG